jgi:hypothetical protein
MATVRLVNQTDMQAFFRVVDNAACERGEKSGVLAVIGGTFSDKEKTKVVEANKLLVFYVLSQSYGTVSSRCQMTLQFTPKDKQEYEIEYTVKDRQCFINVNRLIRDGVSHSRTPEPIHRNPQNCIRAFD